MGEMAEYLYERMLMQTAEDVLDQMFDILPPRPKREHVPKKGPRDWHARRNKKEPDCKRKEWRTRDRMEVMKMKDMTDSHLGHAIRFATTKQQHASRLAALLAERARRA